MMPEVLTAIPIAPVSGEDNEQFIKKFNEFHLQMMKLREAQLVRQRKSGGSASADDNEDNYYQEFYNILELAAQNDNGTQYLHKLEEFIQKQVKDEWLANHLQETMSNSELSPMLNKLE